MKFCNKCGNKITTDSKFCLKCGAKLNSDSEPKINTDFNNSSNSSKNNSNNIKPNFKENLNQDYFDGLKDNEDSNKNSNVGYKKDNSSNHNYNGSNSFTIKKTKKSKKTFFLTFIVILVLVSTGLFLSKDFILYNYYYKIASDKSNITDKLNYYSKAISLKYDNEIINNIYDTLKDDMDFENNINNLNALKKEDKQNLIHRICIYNANKAFNNENYKKTFNYLNIAKKYGYNLKDYSNYNELISKTEKEDKKLSSEENSNSQTNINVKYPENVQKKIDSYTAYIVPNSNTNYLNGSDLKTYTKETLALIRNEIYARHGYIFETEPFKTYFNSKSWYVPNSYFKGSDNELNDYEIKNVQLLKELENKI